ncbi:MAG TPA: hypothetical protein VG326_14405 [Tepidisphaeraceae bacterium]|nr:hypothetical protein [Tepidisphaeraceae bacterium]
MRSYTIAAACALLGVQSLAGAQSTKPAPATLPATQAVATTRPSADSFLPRLASDVWQDRQRAADDLVRMGEDARPIVKQLLARSLGDIDVRTRLETVRSLLDENRILGPSYITIHLKDADPKTVFEEVSRQCYSDLKPFPDNLFDQKDLPKVSVDIDRQPFWTAMSQISEKTGIDLQQYNEGVRLMRGGFRVTSAYSAIQGPFLVVANSITRTQTEMLANGGGSSSEFCMQLVVYSEPKLHVLSSSSTVKIDVAVDNAGNSLIPTAPDNRGYYGGASGIWNLYSQLKFPDKKPGTRIARFKGSADFVVQTKSQQIQIPDIVGIKEVTRVVADIPVVFHEMKKNGEIWELRLSANPQALGPGRWNQFNQSVQSNLQVVDNAGQILDHRGMRSRGTGNGIEFTLLFAKSMRPSDARSSGDPAKVLWEISTGSKEINVPFEFKDLPMPR